MKLIVSKQDPAKGWLLLEVVVALGFGVTVVVALTSVGVRSLHDSTLSQKRAQITRLSQQGIEAVRSIRDQNIRGAYLDSSCNLASPPADIPTCNEWSDVWQQGYVTPKDLKLAPPNASTNYWKLTDQGVPEVVRGISRQVTVSEVSPTPDTSNIKQIKVRAWFVDGGNTYESVQETYLRRL